MGKDPAFLFYPGDYLRDTQNLSEKSQVAYDRILCEHMRNICEDMYKITISKQQLKFFTKRLSEEEREELLFILTEINGGYQIEWVAESMAKRKSYTISRSKNRSSTKKKISKTYDKHMENGDESEDEVKVKKEIIYPFDSKEFLEAWDLWKKFKKEQFKFIYKPIGEQSALKKLSIISKLNENTAIDILGDAMANGYKGFFELKNNNNGKQTTEEAAISIAEDLGREILDGDTTAE